MEPNRMMRIFLALTVAALFVAPAANTDQTDVVATVKNFVVAFNAGDTAAMGAACAPQVVIIDEFPPHVWSGANGCIVWANAFNADAEKNKITDPIVTLGKPTHVDVTGNVAYMVTPATYAYKKAGKPVKETNSILTISLAKGAGGWKMTGWAWAKR
jgi:ketosteroid isomerase-like protein